MLDEIEQEDLAQERDYLQQRVERARSSGRQVDGLEAAKRFLASIPVTKERASILARAARSFAGPLVCSVAHCHIAYASKLRPISRLILLGFVGDYTKITQVPNR
jgi:hypothetical protein